MTIEARDALVVELDAARGAFLAALGGVDLDLVTVPGVVEAWSVRDLVVHVAFWSEHGAEALELAAAGRGDEFAYGGAETDAINERVLAEAQRTDPQAALAREDAGFAAFRERLAGLDPALLDLRLGNGDSVEEVIRYDGPDHYGEHTQHLRAWFGTDAGEDDDDDADDDG